MLIQTVEERGWLNSKNQLGNVSALSLSKHLLSTSLIRSHGLKTQDASG